MDTRKIIKHCKKGNRVAQGDLFNHYYKEMYTISMRILANHHDTEDVLIVSFTKVFKYIERFEYQGENSLKKWIKTIVINESIRFVNSKKRIIYNDDISGYDLNYGIQLFEDDLIDSEKVYSILENMPDGYRMVFTLFAIEGYSHKEIADKLCIAENTSKSQLHKARHHILEQLRKTQNYGQAKH